MGPHHKKKTFPAEFCNECYTVHLHTKRNHIQHVQAKKKKKKKQIQKMIYRLKMAAKLPIFVSRHFDFGKNVTSHFSKEFSMKFGS